MIYIPKTSLETYVSGIVALNILSPDDTGDWHSGSILHANPTSCERYIYGLGQPRNTNYLFGTSGVFDGTSRLVMMGYHPENVPVFIADHPRACADMIMCGLLPFQPVNAISLDDWFPTDLDKARVYKYIRIMEKNLNGSMLEKLKKWKALNPPN